MRKRQFVAGIILMASLALLSVHCGPLLWNLVICKTTTGTLYYQVSSQPGVTLQTKEVYQVYRFGAKKGTRHGKYVSYWPNGLIWDLGYYEDGKQVGIWTEWDEDGTLHVQERFRFEDDYPLEERGEPPWWGDVTDQNYQRGLGQTGTYGALHAGSNPVEMYLKELVKESKTVSRDAELLLPTKRPPPPASVSWTTSNGKK